MKRFTIALHIMQAIFDEDTSKLDSYDYDLLETFKDVNGPGRYEGMGDVEVTQCDVLGHAEECETVIFFEER